MHIQNEFLDQLQLDGFTKRDIRFFVDRKDFRDAVSKTSINKFCKENSVNQGSMYQMFYGKRPVPLDILEKLGLDFNAPCMITGSNLSVNIPIDLTKDLSYLVGALRDGTVVRETNGEYLCAFYNKNKEFVEILQKLVKNVFAIEPKVEQFQTVFGIRVRSLTLYLFFNKVFEVPQHQYSWKTPKIVENASLEIQKAYISGFWDAEGVCPRIEKLDKIKKKNLCVGFVQKNKESLEFIKAILEKSGIKCGNVFWSTNKHVLKVSSSSIQAFSKFICPKHPIKSKRLEEVSKIFSMD